MHQKRIWVALHAAVWITAVSGTTLRAQTRGFGSLAIGVSETSGGEYEDRESVTFDILMGNRFRNASAVSLIAAGFLGSAGAMGHDLVCAVRPMGGCVPDMPGFVYGGAMTGIDLHKKYAMVGIRTGPALIIAGHGTRTLGIHTQAEVAFRIARPLSFTASARSLYMPNVQAVTLHMKGRYFGLRWH